MTAQHHRRPGCRLCHGTDLEEVLSLVPTPPANAFVPQSRLDEAQARFPLDLFFCRDCAHVQLLDVVDPKLLFEDYVYVSGTSPVFVRHFADYAAWVRERFTPSDGTLVFDIGSNDGTLLRAFADAGHAVLGIDPARDIARKATETGIETLTGFFSQTIAERLRAERGVASVITANNVCAHIDDLGAVMDGVSRLLADDGVFVFEVSYLLDVWEKTLFDTIYHEHLDYHSVKPLIPFLAAHGLELIDAVRVGSHGGSLRAVAQKAGGPRLVAAAVADMVAAEEAVGLDQAETFRAFAERIEARKTELGALIERVKAEGATVAGFGAPAKATTLMYHFGLGPEAIAFIVDDSPLKQGLYTPGLHVPVLPSQALYDRRPDYVVILAWNFAGPIIEKHADFRDAGGRFIVPLPELEVI